MCKTPLRNPEILIHEKNDSQLMKGERRATV